MIENILARYAPAAGVAVYAVPDPVAGDQAMAALALRDGAVFDPDGFVAFLAAQPDLGTKMAPRFVRILDALPVTATHKVHRAALRRTGFRCPEPVWWSPVSPVSPAAPVSPVSAAGPSDPAAPVAPVAPVVPAGSAYRRFTAADRAALLALYRDHDRAHLLDR